MPTLIIEPISRAQTSLFPSPGMTEDTVCVGVARLGADDQIIRAATLQQLVSCDLGGPLHSLVVTARLHPLEVDMLRVNAEPNTLEHLQTIDSSTYWSWFTVSGGSEDAHHTDSTQHDNRPQKHWIMGNCPVWCHQ